MGKPQPIRMSSVWAKSTPGLRSTSALSGTAARSSARTSFSDPLAARPIGVRMASTMTASGMGQSPLSTMGARMLRRPARAMLRYAPRDRGEVARVERLGTVAQRGLGILVHLDDDAVRADGRRAARERLDQAPVARRVAGIHDHRQVRVQLEPRHGAEVERE